MGKLRESSKEKAGFSVHDSCVCVRRSFDHEKCGLVRDHSPLSCEQGLTELFMDYVDKFIRYKFIQGIYLYSG